MTMVYTVYVVCTKGNDIVLRDSTFDTYAEALQWQLTVCEYWQSLDYKYKSIIDKGE